MRVLIAGLFIGLSISQASASLLQSVSVQKHQGTQFAHGRSSQSLATAVASSLGEVIEVLNQMLHEFSEQEIQDKANWEEYTKWSDDSEVEKNNFIQEQESLIMANEAKKAANQQEVQKLTNDLAILAEDILETEKSIAELIKMRQEEHAAFQASLADVTKTIAAVTKATGILEGHYGAGGAELVEIRQRVQLALTMYGVHSSQATQQNVARLNSLLQETVSGRTKNPDFLNTDGSKYDSYEKQGGAKGVVGMLTDLRSQLEGQKQDLIAKESNSVRQYEETKAAKETDLANMKQTQAEKTERKANCEATIQQCIATIDQANAEIVEAKAFLKQLLADRAEFTKIFGQRTAMRKQEQAATQAALDALQAVSAGAKSGVGEFMQAALIQTSRLGRTSRSAQKQTAKVAVSAKARQSLQNQFAKLISVGKELGERGAALVQMATKIKQDYFGTEQQSFYDAGAFGPVLKLLSDLIARLEEEAAAETSQHEWCETEKANSVAAKEEREKNIHEYKGTIEAMTTSIAQLKTEILFLMSEIARVEEETRIAKKIREEEHAVYVQAKKDHEEVIGAINTALGALSGQYGFLQLDAKHQRRSEQPGLGSTPFEAYSSGAGGAGSAMEMLQDLLERYSTALAEIIADEKAAVAAHEDLLARNKKFIDETTADKNSKIAERRGTINDLATDKAEMKTNLIELHEVAKYLQDLRPSCDDIRSTYEERKQRREAEIAALKEALQVISDPSMMAA
eukprot:gnl/MRDRNA2_/MRDRNA2_99704_c0_seq1.p1 gnl/MRDRNA2_/MRDRNA2_99704_c0~~gnl/MRDRNA2_/MRDRNA2_99704_c0_seq1.p1  ORF type:complete len:743 (-),score=242.76 gnl/MRDRNA2_/MRDRNA2_99704_c0_seq1:1-2229(-)